MMKKMKFTTAVATNEQQVGEDRLSSLPDELIHHILWFSDARLAVETSVLSKRWRFIWTTLPFLNFPSCRNISRDEIKFVEDFLSHRNHEYDLVKLNLWFTVSHLSFVQRFVNYAIQRNVQQLNLVYNCNNLSIFNSTSLEKLTMCLNFGGLAASLDCWHLPALTTLCLTHFNRVSCSLPISYFTCMPSLRTLSLAGFELPETISLPALTTLHLARCKLPQFFWDFPALLILKLDDVVFPQDTSEFLSTLVNLRDLTFRFRSTILQDFCINIPNLVNLEINNYYNTISSFADNFKVLSPKLRNFTSVGIFPVTFKVSEPENVNVKFEDSTDDQTIAPSKRMKKYYRRVTCMFEQLGSARILTLDSETIKALTAVSDFLVRCPCPFYNLKYVKIPQGYQESGISPHLKCYLLGRSPKATIVTTLPRDELILQRLPVSLTASNQYLFPEKPLTTPLAGTGNIMASSCSCGEKNDIVLWQGHEVKSEFVGLLNLIIKRYPETFEQFNTRNKLFCTMKLNMFCIAVNGFVKSLITDVDTEMVTEFKALFSDLERWGFNVNWLVSRLNYIEQHHCPQPQRNELHAGDSLVDDAKINSRDMKTVEMEKLPHSDNSISLNYIGDGLFSGSLIF